MRTFPLCAHSNNATSPGGAGYSATMPDDLTDLEKDILSKAPADSTTPIEENPAAEDDETEGEADA